MRTDLDHLPPHKQDELERIVQMIFEEFGNAWAYTIQEWKQERMKKEHMKKGRISKIILYGSYAGGDWVDEPHNAKGYQSDYDLLIVVNHTRLTKRIKYWVNLDDRLIREFSITKTLRTPVNFIVHTLGDITGGLANGRCFFIDVARNGIALYQSDDTDLAEPRPMTPHDALDMAREYFDERFPAGLQFLHHYRSALSEGWFNNAVFQLHQAVEHFYSCALLVCTFYTPHVHDLALLRTQAERIDPRLIDAWPREMRADQARFKKLKNAYVKARYSKYYRIDADELAWLGERVEELARLVEVVCSERIAALKSTALRWIDHGAERAPDAPRTETAADRS